MSTAAIQRHTLVYCAADRLSNAPIQTVDQADVAVVKEWVERDRPMIARMRRENDAPDMIALGLPLPLDRGKKRIALSVSPSIIVKTESAPRLEDIAVSLDSATGQRLSLLAKNLPNGIDARVVGSFAWQFLTQEIYVHEKSDIDVIVNVSDLRQVEAALHALIEADQTPGSRIDGEIVLPNGEAASWRELCASSKDILVKSVAGPKIFLRSQWLSQLQDRAA